MNATFEPLWLDVDEVIDMHAEQLAMFGGPEGVRDHGLLESAVLRPINQWHYGETDMAALAAAYGYGLAKNHAFVDGNKRIAFHAMMVFLRMNDISFAPDPGQATESVVLSWTPKIGKEIEAAWRSRPWPRPSVSGLRHGIHAAHHPRAGDGHAVLAGQSRRLSRRDRGAPKPMAGLPMMMTAAGTIAAAKVFIMGVGVAGLQAIATARRLGAVVTATDVRPATKEQVESWAPSSWPSRTTSSRTPRPPAATPRKCPRNTRPSRPSWFPSTSPSRTSSSPRR
jgi:death-on-curing protein